MKPIKDIDSDNNNVSLPETIENKLNEAEIDYEEGRNHTEEERQSQKFMKNLMNDRFQGSMNDAISFMWY